MSTHFAQPSNAAPAGDQTNPAPAPKTNATQGAPEGSAPSSGGGGAFGGLGPILMILPILLIFMTMRGNKKQKQLEANLKTGDTVVTQSGLIGKITEMGENRVKVEIAPGVSVKMLKSAIQGVDGGDTKPGDTKEKDGKQEKPQEKKA